MPKFKMGDRVRILDGSKIENYTGRWASIFSGMSTYVGTIQTIKKVYEVYPDGRVAYLLEDLGYVWDERGLELVSEPKIVITTDGRVTKAAMYKGNQRIKVATSTCHPADEFDFTKGAAIALERLTGQKYGKVENTIDGAKSFDWDGFKAGKFNVIVNRDNSDKFLKECDDHNIAFAHDKASNWNPIKKFDEEPEFVKQMVKAVLNLESTDRCDLKVNEDNGKLEYAFDLKIIKNTVIYD